MVEKIVILGSGESGVGAAILAQKQGMEVFVSDFGKIKDAYKSELEAHQIPFEEGTHSEEIILAATTIIKSPGIPDKAPIIKKIKEKNIPVISEIEFGFRYTKAKVIAITGTNGKTTTTALTYHLLEKAGLNVGLGGNIGTSFARQVANGDKEYFVLEVSSFQLDNCVTFKPHIAVLCNITEDHLDRYEGSLADVVKGPRYATAMGLVMEGAVQRRRGLQARDTRSTPRSSWRWPMICSPIGRPPRVWPQSMLAAGCSLML